MKINATIASMCCICNYAVLSASQCADLKKSPWNYCQMKDYFCQDKKTIFLKRKYIAFIQRRFLSVRLT
ncbi:hypothetical protein T05_16004 [Trichinella murrelli]|uniref:Uncharacterized protein n=1 Tax=Trichinella murrelli TaxID=144512 RepID=A0A0V0TLF7_9BILA|nr:hypothetical protein T05_16004 [Trichinella murrelli]